MKQFLILSILSFSISCLSQDTIKVKTQDDIKLNFSEKLKELQKKSKIFIRFDGTCFQYKEENHQGKQKSLLYYFKINDSNYISFRKSKYKNFDDYEDGKEMSIIKTTKEDLLNYEIIDIIFLFENGMKQTFYALRSRGIEFYLIDETNNKSGNEIYAFEVVMNSSF